MKIAKEKEEFPVRKEDFSFKKTKPGILKIWKLIILRLIKTNLFLWLVSVLIYGTL